jgi:hypothetical protein
LYPTLHYACEISVDRWMMDTPTLLGLQVMAAAAGVTAGPPMFTPTSNQLVQ